MSSLCDMPGLVLRLGDGHRGRDNTHHAMLKS